MKARRGDLSGPILPILVTLVVLAIGAVVIAYFVLLGAAPQQGVVAVLGQPTMMKAGANDIVAVITIKNVGSTTIDLSQHNVLLNVTGVTVHPTYISRDPLPPGALASINFIIPDKWSVVATREAVSGALTIRGVGTMEVVFRVIKLPT